jgi:RNA polymerase sigma-70 factor, ECF subfamily
MATLVPNEEGERLTQLMPAIAAGDRNAFRTMYDIVSPRLLGIARQLVRRQEVAEEIVQEAFVVLWERAGDYDARLARPLTWLAAIVRNRALDMLRRPAVEVPMVDEHVLEAIPSGEYPADIANEWRETKETLRVAMTSLAPAQRQAITLAFYHGLTHAEIAEHMDRPLGTIKTLVRRGLMKMKGALDDDRDTLDEVSPLLDERFEERLKSA